MSSDNFFGTNRNTPDHLRGFRVAFERILESYEIQGFSYKRFTRKKLKKSRIQKQLKRKIWGVGDSIQVFHIKGCPIQIDPSLLQICIGIPRIGNPDYVIRSRIRKNLELQGNLPLDFKGLQ